MSVKAKTSTPSATHTAAVMSTLTGVTPLEALDHLGALDDTNHLVPAGGDEQLMQDLVRIATTAQRLNYDAATMLSDMVALLKTTTGIHSITQFHNDADGERLHHDRNLILVLVLAAAVTYGGDHHTVLRLAHRVHTPRTRHAHRPLTTDEILLARLHVHLLADTARGSVTAGTYALVEAGCTPAEACLTTPAAVDDLTAPAEVLADDNDQLEPRLLTLDTYERRILSRAVAGAHRHLPTAGYLFYNPTSNIHSRKKPKNAATALSNDRLTRLLSDLGINNADVIATSIRNWRLLNTYHQHGEIPALEQAGFPAHAYERLRKITNLPAHDETNTTTIRRDDLDTFVAA